MSASSANVWTSFRLCLGALLVRPGRLVRQLWFPVAWSLALYALALLLIHALGVGLKDVPAPRTSGSGVAKALVEKMEAWDKRPSAFHSRLVVEVVGPPEKIERVLPQLQKEGLNVVVKQASATPPAAQLSWTGAEWELTGTERGWGLLLWPRVSAAVGKSREAARLPGGFETLSDGRFEEEFRRTHQSLSGNLVVLVLVVPLLLSMGLLFFRTASHVEQARSEGLLEALALARQPFWIYILAYCVAQGLQYMALVVTMLLVAGVLVEFMHPLSMVCLALAGTAMATALSCLGFSTAFFWKSKSGRMFAMMATVPAATILLGSWTLGVLLERGAPPGLRGVAFLQRAPSECVPLLVGALLCALVVCPAVCAFVQWRVGRRWEGLSRG